MTRTSRLLLVPVIVAAAAFFFYVSQHRLVDDDEGYYLLAARLVLQHKTPYLDFFYQQAPLLPYVYAAWFKLAGLSWVSARVFCALLSTLLAGLIYRQVSRETGKWLAGAVAVLLYATASLDFAWYPIVKTFALVMVFLFPAYMIFTRLEPSTPGWRIALAGALVGLAADTRSYVVGVVPIFLYWLWRRRRESLATTTAWFLGGLILGALPSLILFAASPSAFLYNNLGYHAMRTKAGLVGNFYQKLMMVAAVAGGAYTGFQFTVTAAVAIALVVLLRTRRDSSLLALLIAAALGVVSLLPTPASMQYFALVMPFVIVAAVCCSAEFLRRSGSPHEARRTAALYVMLGVGFVGFGLPVLRQYLFTGHKVPGIRDAADVPNWTLPRLAEVSQAVNELTQPGEPVVSFFPGYIFATHADPYPGFENNFGFWVARDLSPERRAQLHLLSGGDIARVLARRGLRLVVVNSDQGEWNSEPDTSACVTALDASGYRIVRQVGDVYFYQAP